MDVVPGALGYIERFGLFSLERTLELSTVRNLTPPGLIERLLQKIEYFID